MKTRLLQIAILCLAGLCSCVPRPTHYGPIDNDGYGYREMPLGDSTYRIVFAGNPQTSLELVDRYSLYRSAELTLTHGGSYFIILSDKADINTTSSSGGTSAADASVSNSTQPAGSVFPSSTKASASTSNSYYSSTVTLHSSIKNIRYCSGVKPHDNPNAYDAKAIVSDMDAQLSTDKTREDQAVSGTTTLYTVYYIFVGVVTVIFLAIYASRAGGGT